MAQVNPFLKYIVRDTKEDVVHSSAYAQAQSGGSMGAASTESFQVRVNIDRNRKMIQGYNRSEVMTGAQSNRPGARTYVAEKDLGVRGGDVSSGRVSGASNERAGSVSGASGVSGERAGAGSGISGAKEPARFSSRTSAPVAKAATPPRNIPRPIRGLK